MLAILIRKLKDIHFAMINFHYGYFAVATCFIFLLIEHQVLIFWEEKEVESSADLSKDHAHPHPAQRQLRLLTYNSFQMAYMSVLSIINSCNVCMLTVALQIEKSAYVSLLTMGGVVWACLYDFGFGDAGDHMERRYWQLVGAALVLACNVTAVILKFGEGK